MLFRVLINHAHANVTITEVGRNATATFSLPAKALQEVAAVAEGAALGAYSFTEFRGSTKAQCCI